MTTVQVIAAVSTVLGIATVLGVAYAVLRSTLASTTNTLWERNASALEARVKILEETEKECKKELEHIKDTNKVLVEQVSGAGAIALLSAKIDKQHADVIALLGGSRKSDSVDGG